MRSNLIHFETLVINVVRDDDCFLVIATNDVNISRKLHNCYSCYSGIKVLGTSTLLTLIPTSFFLKKNKFFRDFF